MARMRRPAGVPVWSERAMPKELHPQGFATSAADTCIPVKPRLFRRGHCATHDFKWLCGSGSPPGNTRRTSLLPIVHGSFGGRLFSGVWPERAMRTGGETRTTCNIQQRNWRRTGGNFQQRCAYVRRLRMPVHAPLTFALFNCFWRTS